MIVLEKNSFFIFVSDTMPRTNQQRIAEANELEFGFQLFIDTSLLNLILYCIFQRFVVPWNLGFIVWEIVEVINSLKSMKLVWDNKRIIVNWILIHVLLFVVNPYRDWAFNFLGICRLFLFWDGCCAKSHK